MRVFIKWEVIFVFIAILIFLVIFANVNKTKIKVCSVPQQIDYYCNNPTEEGEGSEGDVPEEDYQLMSIHVITRHGDRSSLHILDTKNMPTKSFRCLFDQALLKSIPILNDFIKEMTHQKKFFQNPLFPHPLFPESLICPTGILTPKGSAQQLKNGLLLQQKYHRHQLIIYKTPSQIDYSNIKVVSTKYSRTFQSAVAFMFGFLPHLDLSKLPLIQTPLSNMCSNNSFLNCDCPAVIKSYNTFSCTFDQTWSQNKMEQRQDLDLKLKIWNIFSFNASKPPPPPSPIYDNIVTHYCHSNSYVDNCLLDEIFFHVNNHGSKISKNGRYVELAILKMLPLINEITERIIKTSSFSSSHPLFYLYSGHDSTLEPLVSALGVGNGFWPKYASRFVIEQYRKYKSNEIYFRFLYDGKPVTHLFQSCQGDEKFIPSLSLCPLIHLTSFTDKHIQTYRYKCFHNPQKKNEEKMPIEGKI